MLLDLRTLEEPISGTGSVSFGVAVSATGIRSTPQGIGLVGTSLVNFDIPETGSTATGNVGSVAIDANVTLAITGVFGTGSVGTDGVAFDLGTTGQSSTSSLGSLASLSVNVALSGQAGTGAVSAPTTSETYALSGLSATTSIGTVTEGDADALAGLEAASAIGTLSLSSVVGTTGDAATGAAGTEVPGHEVTAVGQFGTGSLGSETLSVDVSVSGDDATGSVGNTGAVTGTFGALSGVFATSAIASMGVPIDGTGNVTIGAPILSGVGHGPALVGATGIPLLPRLRRYGPRNINGRGGIVVSGPAVSAVGHVQQHVRGAGIVTSALPALVGKAGQTYSGAAEIAAPGGSLQAVGRLYGVERVKAGTLARATISGTGGLTVLAGQMDGELTQALPDAVDLAWAELQRSTSDPSADDDACMALGVFE